MDAHITAYIEAAFLKIRLLKSSDKGEVWLASEKSGRLVIRKHIAWTGLPYAMLKEKGYPLIPRILHCIEEDGETLVVEEYVQGESLLDRIGRKAYLSEREAGNILLQLCDGLAPIHAQGIVHRDIKPSNLILQSGCIIRLIDFDAARTVKEHSGEDTMHLGTKGYAPPEQFGYGQTDARSDIYSIGITMQKALPEEYGGYLAGIFAKCMEIDPDRRYRNLQELRRALIFRRFWAGRGKAALWTLAIVSAVVFCILQRFDGAEPLPSTPASESKTDSPDARLPSAAEERPAAPTSATSDERLSVQSPVPSGTEPEQEVAVQSPVPSGTEPEQEVAVQSPVPSGTEPEQEVAVSTPSTSIEPMAHERYIPPTASQEERKSIKSVDAFLAEFKDDPEKLAYWQLRKEVFSSSVNTSEEGLLEAMKGGELGLRVDAFIKNLPPMTEAERNRAIDEFVADQRRLLDL